MAAVEVVVEDEVSTGIVALFIPWFERTLFLTFFLCRGGKI